MNTDKNNKSQKDAGQDFLGSSAGKSQFPATRMRRLRTNGWIRDIVAQHTITTNDVIWPLFVTEGQNNREAISSMPGVERLSVDLVIEQLKPAIDLGLKAAALFPVVPKEKKTQDGAESYNPNNLICTAIAQIKAAFPQLGIISDIALDPYTSHGHDGVLKDGKILNDETIELLIKQSLVQAQSGADILAPSDMMDGRIGAIRGALETGGYKDVMLLSYAAKYASVFYGPFRDAVNSGDFLTGDKKTYQMNPANKDEALREIALDIDEGADMIMIKPGIPYLDVVKQAADNFNVPIFAYHVSGEFSMLKAAAQKGWIDYESALMETLLSFKRAGATGIFTYGAYDCLKILNKASKNKAAS